MLVGNFYRGGKIFMDEISRQGCTNFVACFRGDVGSGHVNKLLNVALMLRFTLPVKRDAQKWEIGNEI